MAQLLHVVFKAEEIKKLLELDPDKIVIRTSLESGTLDDDSRVGYVVVKADAMKEGEEKPLGTIGGCPNPPCD
jgi:hypothetical protein